MLCEDIMRQKVKTLAEHETTQAAARLMRDANIGFLPIVSATGMVVGTLTDRDIVLKLAGDSQALSQPVAHLMTRSVVFCRPKDDLRRAEQLMLENKKSRIICTDDHGRPVGVISLSDIAQHEDGPHLSRLMRAIAHRETRPVVT